MTNSKLVLAVGLAAAAFVLATNAIVELHGQLAALVGISAIGLSVAAFVVSLGQRSFVVAGLLAAAGIMYMIRGLIALGDSSVIVLPGPINGVIFGVMILGLGMAKGIRSARPTAVAARRS
jgi:hypothetical protein